MDHDLTAIVLDHAAAVIAGAAVPSGFRALLDLLVQRGREQAAELEVFAPVELPLGVYAAITDDLAAGLPIATACTLAYLGIDAFDDALDRELPPLWTGHAPVAVALAGASA